MWFRQSPIKLAVAAAVLSACSTKIETPYSDPLAFDTTTYCNSVDRSAPLEIPINVSTVLEAESPDEEAYANALLSEAALQIAHASDNPDTCQSAFEIGEVNFLSALAVAQENMASKGGFDASGDFEILPVQIDITRLWREDQSSRRAYIALKTEDRSGADYWAQRRAIAHGSRIDAESKRRIEAYADEYGWIDSKRFGKSVSAHAWILVQHADDHPDFQAEILERMEPFVERGETSKKNYAYLWDRVAVNTGRKQRYGTQPTWECDDQGKMALQPLENPETVNQRRTEVGLNSVEEGLATMERQVCGVVAN